MSSYLEQLQGKTQNYGSGDVTDTGTQSVWNPNQNTVYPTSYSSNAVLGLQDTINKYSNTVNNPPAPAGGGNGKITASQALAEGKDINVLRAQGLLAEEGGGDMGAYNAEVDSMYNAGMGAWNVAEQGARSNMVDTESMLTSGQEADSAQLGLDKTSALGTLAGQQKKGQTQKEDAMAAARRLYSELQMGNRQRFGGATSAGQAASEIQGAEFQRQQGQTTRQAADFFQEIEGAKNSVEEKFKVGLLQIKQKTTELLTQAKMNFTNLIAQIAQGRAQTETQKSTARLNALMQLRNEAFQVQQQKVLEESQLTQMREQARLNIDAYQQTTGSETLAGQNALTNFNPIYDNFSKVAAGTQFTQPTQIGQINKKVTGKDYLGRTIWVDPNTSQQTYGWTNPQTGK